MDSNVQAGWYADPDGLPCQRYWDGNSWTSETRPVPTLSGKPAPLVEKRNTGLDGKEIGMLVAAIVLLILVAAAFSGTGL